jgi:hypothetical protein
MFKLATVTEYKTTRAGNKALVAQEGKKIKGE